MTPCPGTDGQCFVDQHPGRVLDGLTPSNGYPHYRVSDAESDGVMTIEMCVTYCKDRNFSYAGLQHYDECYCGNTYPTVLATDGCTYECAGDSSQTCGGTWRINVHYVV